MQFEVHGQPYFLNFLDEEGRWYVFEPTSTGVNRMPVYEDTPKFDRFGILESGRHNTQN